MVTTIRVSNDERDAAMPPWVARSEALRHYWRSSLEIRCDLSAADSDEYRETATARISARLERQYEEWQGS